MKVCKNKIDLEKNVNSFKNNNLGFFIHYGPYSFLEAGEWYKEMNNNTLEEYYEKINLNNKNFNIDFDKILTLMKQNGFKYAIFTTKHHDGFAMYDSKGLSKYDVNITKNKRNLVKEFVKKCIEHEIEPILYHATLDWSKRDFEEDFDEYLKYLYKSVEFLCNEFPEVRGFWFDGNWSKPDADWKLNDLYSMIKTKIKNAIIINNSGMEEVGKEQHPLVDSITFEQGIIKKVNYCEFSRPLFSEVCQSFNDHWGYARKDYNFKSPASLIRKLIESKINEANYVINISIDSNGDMIPIEIETIKMFGQWVKKYGQIFYRNYATLDIKNEDIVFKEGNKVYIYLSDIYSGGHVKKIHDGGGVQPIREYNIPFKIKKAIYLDNFKDVIFEQKDDKFILTPNSFDYGVNTIIRVIEAEVE